MAFFNEETLLQVCLLQFQQKVQLRKKIIYDQFIRLSKGKNKLNTYYIELGIMGKRTPHLSCDCRLRIAVPQSLFPVPAPGEQGDRTDKPLIAIDSSYLQELLYPLTPELGTAPFILAEITCSRLSVHRSKVFLSVRQSDLGEGCGWDTCVQDRKWLEQKGFLDSSLFYK